VASLLDSARRISRASENLRWFRPTPRQLLNRALYEVLPARETVKYRPVWLLLYLTDNCNLKCEMCPHHTTRNVDDFPYMKELTPAIPLDLISKILSRFRESIVVSLAGVGEPLLHPQFVEVIHMLSEANKIIDVTTNGYTLRGRRAEALTSTRLVREVTISLNGADADEHLEITGTDGFERVLENVRTFVQMRSTSGYPQRIAVSQVCTRSNLDRWHSYVDLAASLGVDRLYLHNVIDMQVRSDALRVLPSNARMNTAIHNLPRHVGGLEIIPPVPIKPFQGPPRCQWFFKNLAFDANGTMGSCGRVMNPQAEYGNLSDEGDIWNNVYMRTLRKSFLDPDGANLESCCYSCVENFDPIR
jgi:radical SAM protein with 4Fe4S-binding SPASM domain